MDRIERIFKKIKTLSRLDKDQKVFGACEHRYEFRPWSSTDVDELEAKIENTIPAELRLWLQHVGSGAGPNYGLHVYKDDQLERSPTGPAYGGDFQRLTDVTAAELQALIDQAWNATPDDKTRPQMPPTITTRADRGGHDLLCLGHAGCSDDYVMPLSGDFRGKVFYRTDETIDQNEVENGSMLWPQGLCRTKGYHLTLSNAPELGKSVDHIFGFLDWMEDWAECEIFNFKNFNTYEHQVEIGQIMGRARSAPRNRVMKFMHFLGLQ